MEVQDWNKLFQESESNAWGRGTLLINVADLVRNDWASLENLPAERGQGRSGHQAFVGYDAPELGSRTKHRSPKDRNESDDLLSRSEHRPSLRISSKYRDDELSRLQHCPPRSTASKTRVHRQGRRKSMGCDYIPPDILEEEFNVNASQIFEFEKQGEQEEAFGTTTVLVASTTTSHFLRKSLGTSSTRRKDNSARYEYEEPIDMRTSGKKERTRRSLDVGGDEYSKAGSSGGRDDDLEGSPKRSRRRTPRRSSMGVLPSASMMSAYMSNPHLTTETYNADISVFTAPVDTHQGSSKFRSMRGSMLADSNSSIGRDEKMRSGSRVKAQAMEQRKNRKARSSRHRASRRSSIGSSASPPKSHHDSSSGGAPPSHQVSRRSSIGGASRTTTAGRVEASRPARRMPRRSSTGYSETILAATASFRNRGPVTNVADADLSIFDFPTLSESKIDFDRMQMSW